MAKKRSAQEMYKWRVAQRGLYCLICRKLGAEFHHLKTVRSGGTDDKHNLFSACRECHTKFHQLGLSTMAERYPIVKEILLRYGWTYEESIKKWRHYKGLDGEPEIS